MDPWAKTDRFGGHVEAIGRFEHITISGEHGLVDTAAEQLHRRPLRRFTLESSFHRCATELTLLQGYHLGVRCARPGTEPRRYQVDLRFANPTPVRVLHIPWPSLLLGTGFAGLGVAALTGAGIMGVSALGKSMIIGGAAASIAVLLLRASFRRMTESLQFRSVHGHATLVRVVGGIGSTRRDTTFLSEVTDAINAARHQRAQDGRQFLCDEMREHHRLHQLGVLSDAEYEASKARILAAH